MKIARPPHRWSVTPSEAIQIQKRLAGSVRKTKPRGSIRFVAGVDMAFSRDGERCLAGVVLWDSKEESVVGYRLPEPTRLADRLVAQLKRET